MSKGLLPTAVGSYPKPDYITRARNQVARKDLAQEELDGEPKLPLGMALLGREPRPVGGLL